MVQAETAGRNLNNVPWFLTYSSDLCRAKRTTDIILSKSLHGEEGRLDSPVLSEWLREIHFGVREGLSRSLSPAEALVQYAQAKNLPVDEVVDTAESLDSVRARQHNFVVQLLRDSAKKIDHHHHHHHHNNKPPHSDSSSSSRKVLCVTHGGYIKQFLKNFCPGSVEQKIGNCALTVVSVEWPDATVPDHFCCSAAHEDINIACVADSFERFNVV